ncbi:hypothetical protein ACHRV1_25795 [Flavobacterium aquidurense]|uniref:DUF4359 domain-containing protein n=1 Tax=Flavobacterium piscisymbiosum TaxID=2893753 RepID=A0ABS8MHQ8_9FLAO|nr:hypothetical protein [Flavobacterium sp. F-30]MCC9065022.1 hypothetical protein [Flavobacterium sp. F-30]
MKKWFTKFLLLFIILLGGQGNVNAQSSQLSHHQLNLIIPVINSVPGHCLDRGRFFETFKRKACLLDNEETEENFAGIQKQLVKSTYFLNFLGSNKLTEYTVAFTKKVNYRKIFNLFSNKVYVLFQVFRI